MKDVIDMLLQKQATLDEDCEYAKMVECEKIDNAFAERKAKIKSLLAMAGYEPPVVVDAIPHEQAVAENVAEAAEVAEVAEAAAEYGAQPVTVQKVY